MELNDKNLKTENMANTKKAKVIMVQGTMSNAGKSLLVAGLCRVFAKDGYKVYPFKSQNMALNSFITKDGLEMGRAQVMQAECAGVEPLVYMNPILLKPTSDVGSQVIVNGKSIGNMPAREYFQYKTKLIPDIMAAYNKLSEDADIIVVEGAGSPAEINLKTNDIVNMGLAKMLDADVILVGDIDRGGVFAQLYGTVELLEKEEKERIKGFVINKFRGDKSLLDPGIEMIEKKSSIKTVGVIPYMNIKVEDEDSLSERFNARAVKDFDIVVIKLPHISNYTDFDVFEQSDDISLRYVDDVTKVGSPDILIIPGSKNTIADLEFIYKNGFDNKIRQAKSEGTVIIGICGGYQILGEEIADPDNMEEGGKIKGLSLLPIKTVIKNEKKTNQFEGIFSNDLIKDNIFNSLANQNIKGYEIHMGETIITDKTALEFTGNGTGYYKDNVYGSYIHGLFDNANIAALLIEAVALKNNKKLASKIKDYREYKESQYDILENVIRQYMDMPYIYSLLFGDK